MMITPQPLAEPAPKRALMVERPGFFAEAELQDFIARVREGGEIADDQRLDGNIRNAERLLFLRHDDLLAGVAALKHPRQSYRDRIARGTGVTITPDAYPFELGYIFVDPAARRRGVASQLAAAALGAADGRGVFATARTDNPGIHAVLTRAGFAKAGIPYPGQNTPIQLFVLPHAT